MKHITEHFDEKIYTSNILDFYFCDMKICVLDIETTGLDPSRNKFILGGLFDIQSGTMHQVFAENRGEEKKALEAFYSLLSDYDMVITYNGKHFDMPFIARRMKAHGIGKFAGIETNIALEPAQLLPYNLDLYLVVNGHSPIKKFVPNLKQKTVENYMGLWQSRDDEISGAESVELYNKYEKNGDVDLEAKILLHNSDDVLQLARLIKVLSKCDMHRAMYHLGFPAWKSKSLDHTLPNVLIVDKIKTEKNSLFISGKQKLAPISNLNDEALAGESYSLNTAPCGLDYMGFSYGDWPVESRFDSRDMSFSMQLPVIRDSGLCIIDLKAAGLDCSSFEKYPTYSSGFLVLEDHNDRNFMETNHFLKVFLKAFMGNI